MSTFPFFFAVIVLISPKEDRRRFMLTAYELGMTNGDYVFFTMEMLPEDDLQNSAESWFGGDGRNTEAKLAFESVFHVRIHCTCMYICDM